MPCRVGGNTALVLRRKCQSLGTLVDAVDVSKRKDAHEALELASMLRAAIRGKRSQMPIGGGCGNRTAGNSPGSDDSRTVSRTDIEENTSKEHEQNALPDILMTMSQIPDVNRELAEIGAMFAVVDALRRKR